MIGWPICANAIGLDGVMPIKYGSCFLPMPGYDLTVLDENHDPVPPNTLGTLAIKLPLPPGFMSSLYNGHQRFIDSYMYVSTS